MSITIAIDGPSGAGKSTIAKEVAQRLGFTYVDTGAIYRAIGLYVFRRGIDPSDEASILPLLPQIQIKITQEQDGQHIFLGDEDVSAEIRRHEMSHYASAVSAIAKVREFLLDTQRRLAADHNCIMDGRDIGTVVLPDADLKIFLTADPKDRAARRQIQLSEKGIEMPYEQVLKDLIERDQRDSTREAAPLRQAPGAILLDTTGNTKAQSVNLVEKLIREKLADVL
ncbi:Cytidylate kinase [bioreactor metagenome]|uniref:(d)CMP kinase n=1 Tax=bioreactor metagenome TaxID=1076179 RepID=A0A645AIZ2_9ZZZZ